MSRRTLAWIAGALVLGWACRIPGILIVPEIGGSQISALINGFCVTVWMFFSPVLLNLDWWATMGILAFAFWTSHQSTSAPPSA